MAKEEQKGLVKYESRGQEVVLTASIVREFLVTGKKELVTDQEIYYFLGICKARQLNPFVKDCYLIKYGSEPAAIVTAIDFYRSRARAQKDCVGWEAGVICQNNKTKELRYSKGIVLPDETLLGGWFRARPKGWEIDFELEVNLDGYIKKTSSGDITKFWSKPNQPSQIRKVVESQGLRTVWPDLFQGTVTGEELGVDLGDIDSLSGTPPSGGDITPKSEPDSKTIDFSKLKNFAAFAALWGPKIQDLHPDDQETRTRHLDLYLNKNTQAAAKQHKMPPAKAAEKVLDHFIARFEEIWGKFLTWENMPEHPWNQEQADKNRPWVDPKATVTEPGAEAGPAEKAEAETSGEDEGPATEGEGQAEEPFEARKNRVWGLVVKKYGSTKDMKANVGIARSADITEDNVDEIEEKVT